MTSVVPSKGTSFTATVGSVTLKELKDIEVDNAVVVCGFASVSLTPILTAGTPIETNRPHPHFRLHYRTTQTPLCWLSHLSYIPL